MVISFPPQVTGNWGSRSVNCCQDWITVVSDAICCREGLGVVQMLVSINHYFVCITFWIHLVLYLSHGYDIVSAAFAKQSVINGDNILLSAYCKSLLFNSI